MNLNEKLKEVYERLGREAHDRFRENCPLYFNYQVGRELDAESAALKLIAESNFGEKNSSSYISFFPEFHNVGNLEEDIARTDIINYIKRYLKSNLEEFGKAEIQSIKKEHNPKCAYITLTFEPKRTN